MNDEEEIATAAPMDLHTVMQELRVIRQELAEVKRILNPEVTGSTLKQDLEASLKENNELRNEIRIHKDNTCRIEREKYCLMKSLSLKKQSETKETTALNNSAGSFVGRHECHSTIPRDIIADSQPSVSGDDDEPEISQQNVADSQAWTRVEGRRKSKKSGASKSEKTDGGWWHLANRWLHQQKSWSEQNVKKKHEEENLQWMPITGRRQQCLLKVLALS